jgi:hypothetical protein
VEKQKTRKDRRIKEEKNKKAEKVMRGRGKG